MYSTTISWTKLSLRVLGPRSRSQRLLLEKHYRRYSAFMYGPILILLHTNVLCDYILDRFEFECSRAKVNVTVAFLEKNVFITLAPTFMDRFSFYFTQLSIMKIPWTSLNINCCCSCRVVVLRPR